MNDLLSFLCSTILLTEDNIIKTDRPNLFEAFLNDSGDGCDLDEIVANLILSWKSALIFISCRNWIS